MFSFIKKQPEGDEIIFKISGMHCTSCSMNIDGALEDTDGVISSKTNFAQSKTVVQFDSKKISKGKLMKVIEEVGYSVTD